MRLTRGGWAVTAIAAAGAYVLGPEASGLVRDLGGPSFPAALLALGSLVQLTLSTWALVVAALSLTGRTSRLARAITPGFVRRAVFVGAVGALTIAPAHAEQGASPRDDTPHSLDGLRLPDRPSGVTTTAHRAPSAGVVVVRAGDTLWDIASRSLPPGATDADVASATRDWHRSNDTVIGTDPDQIFPGQRLTPPRGKDRP